MRVPHALTPPPRVAQPPVKPLLRGVSHEIAAGLALAGAVVLAVLAPTTRGRIGAAVYGLSLVTLFTVSATYHRPNWAPRARLFMRRLDHSAIFLLIAGTYTPLCLLLGGTTGYRLLAGVWAGALVGVVQSVAWPRAPKALVAALAVALGWAVVPMLPTLTGVVGTPGLVLLGGGGALYTLGAVIYATGRPDPFPRVFGYHEVFHALVIAAAALHFAVVAGAVRAIG
ncbi:MAG: hemolysin III family protein [Deltaproteobacteria bacterium]|nr:hemolysin III family protein [Deltaproteobacteria bacterium]